MSPEKLLLCISICSPNFPGCTVTSTCLLQSFSKSGDPLLKEDHFLTQMPPFFTTFYCWKIIINAFVPSLFIKKARPIISPFWMHFSNLLLLFPRLNVWKLFPRLHVLTSAEPSEHWEELKKVYFLSHIYDTLVLNGCALFTRLYHSADQCTFYSVPKPSSFLLFYCLASWFILLCVPCFFLSECSALYSY